MITDKSDIDESHKAQEQLSLLKQESNYIIENNLAMMMLVDAESGRILDANKIAVDFYKYPKEKLLDMSISEINIMSQTEVLQRINRVKDDQRFSFITNHKLADGSIKTVRINSSKIILNNKLCLFSIIWNIAETIYPENEHAIINKQLKDSLMFNQNLIQNASEGIVVYDKDLRYTVWNKFMARAIGLEASEVIGKHTSEIFEKDTYEKVIHGLKRSLEGEVIIVDPVEFINPDTKVSGFTREVYSPNYDSEGNIIGVVCIISDITSIIQYQKSLAKKNEELKELNKILSEQMVELEIAKNKSEESDRLKSAFLAHVSHEIRTPLNSIVGFSTLLKDAKNPEIIKKYNNIIQTNNLFLLNIIEDILTYSSIETNDISVKATDFDLIHFLKGLFNNFKQIATKQVSLKLSTHDFSSLIVKTDENKLYQVISNLLTNAFKFTKIGIIEFGIDSYDSDSITIYVKDSGIGIAEENQQIIFTRFYKFNSLEPGSGLGLSICKALCEKINAPISLVSKPDIGSTFFIKLPYSFISQGGNNDK